MVKLLSGGEILSELSDKTGIKPVVIEEIKEIAKKYDVCKVILFGSRARGDYYKKSDIDLAISGGDKTAFSLDINETTSTLLEYDVVDLDKEIQQKLRASIEKEGITIYEKV